MSKTLRAESTIEK